MGKHTQSASLRITCQCTTTSKTDMGHLLVVDYARMLPAMAPQRPVGCFVAGSTSSGVDSKACMVVDFVCLQVKIVDEYLVIGL